MTVTSANAAPVSPQGAAPFVPPLAALYDYRLDVTGTAAMQIQPSIGLPDFDRISTYESRIYSDVQGLRAFHQDYLDESAQKPRLPDWYKSLQWYRGQLRRMLGRDASVDALAIAVALPNAIIQDKRIRELMTGVDLNKDGRWQSWELENRIDRNGDGYVDGPREYAAQYYYYSELYRLLEDASYYVSGDAADRLFDAIIERDEANRFGFGTDTGLDAGGGTGLGAGGSTFAAVPEPASLVLLGMGVIVALRRRRA